MVLPVICVIDGQGGGIGSVIVKALRREFGEGVEVVAVGTNAIAASSMMKAGANRAASGENAILVCVGEAGFVMGPLGVVLANAMLGEVSPRAAEAVASCRARKLLLPLNQDGVEVAGVIQEPLPHLVDELVKTRLRRWLEHV